jgi:hypothetical protein
MEVPGRTASWAAILILVLLTGGAAAGSIATARGELSGAPPLSPTVWRIPPTGEATNCPPGRRIWFGGLQLAA